MKISMEEERKKLEELIKTDNFYQLKKISKEVIKEKIDIIEESLIKMDEDDFLNVYEYLPKWIMEESKKICDRAIDIAKDGDEDIRLEIFKNLPDSVKENNEWLCNKIIEVFVEINDLDLKIPYRNYSPYFELPILEYLPQNVIQKEKNVKILYPFADGIWKYLDIEKAIELAKEELKKNPYSIGNIPQNILVNCPDECVQVLRKKMNYTTIKYCPKEVLEKNPEICKRILQKRYPFELVPTSMQVIYKDICKDIIYDERYLEKDSIDLISDFKNLADEIKIEDPDICLYYIKNKVNAEYDYYGNMGYNLENIKMLEGIPKKLWESPEFYKKLIGSLPFMNAKTYSKFAEYIPKELFENREFIEQIYQYDYNFIFYADNDILNEILNKSKDVKIGSEWQDTCNEEIENQDNVILASPTGSGKTRVFLKWALEKQERPIYITAPIKALSNQRYRELKEQGFTVGLETGDIKDLPKDCDFICCTQEIYTNKHIDEEGTTLIMDEFHYIFENPDRTRTYINALNKSKAKNMLLCSATMGNINELKEYVEKVSGRKFFQYENRDRLTELSYKNRLPKGDIKNALVVTFSRKNIDAILSDLSSSKDYDDIDEKIEEKNREKIQELASKYKIDEESDLIYYAEKGIAGYYGGLLPKEKLFIEECFENKVIDTVVGTDALALGVNFPIENVVFTQLAKYYDGPISKNLFDQLAGRAGRKGFFDTGNVYFCDGFKNFDGYPLEARNYDTETLYRKYLFMRNEDISIIIKPEIKEILTGETKVEDEAQFIMDFSTEEIKFEDILSYVEDRVSYIKDYDLVEKIIDEEFYFDEYEEYEEYEEYDEEKEDEEEISQEQEKIEKRRKELELIQQEFDENIAKVYFEEFDTEKNCEIFTDILLGVDMSKLIDKYAKSFSDILQLRKYVKQLPKRYRKNIDIAELDERINNIDETALNINRGKVTVQDIEKGTREEQLDMDSMNKILKDMKEQMEISQERETKLI